VSDCLFCKIARGDVAAEIVFDDKAFVAFLDHRPVFKSHTLLIPRKHVEVFEALPPELETPFLRVSKVLSLAVEKAMNAEGTFLAINNKVSQSVPHLHLHVVPRTKGDGLKGFFWPRTKYASPEEMAEVGERIRAVLRAKELGASGAFLRDDESARRRQQDNGDQTLGFET